MSSQLIRSGECRKFSPNIFNKTKCTNCFRQKEEHSAEALESNRATRKIVKCGYLFVAPGWDFTNPINRNKRWQRRWFVLYDDGELSYSLDEHPETVPQASIDMNSVLEVTSAEEITGNSFSIAITAQDNVHFVKGTCREEARFWTDVLSVFPRTKGRHKRNATFPGTQSSTKNNHILQSPLRSPTEAVRNQYNARISAPVWEGDVFPTRDIPSNNKSSTISEQIPQTNNHTDTRKAYMGSPPTRDKVDDKARSRRVVNREKRGLKTGRSFSEDISKMVPNWQDKPSQGHPEMSRRLLLEEYENECKLKDIADSLTQPTRARLQPNNQRTVEPTRENDTSHKQIRGDPDGCGLDMNSLRYSPSDLRVDLPAEELLNIKKGWLMKQGQEKEWTKHWFVLRGNALLYYRDPTAEDQGILDGVIDLSGVTSVSEVQVQRNYGFQTTTWDEKHYVLSAVTGGFRQGWLTAIKKAAGLTDSSSNLSSPTQEHEEIVTSTPLTPRSLLFSSDEEYRTASEGGRRESGEWGEALPPSPPLNRTPMSKVKERARGVSKWKMYTNNNKRSRSSPPSSRRSTLDSVSSQEIVLACCNQQSMTDDAQEELLRRKRQSDISALEKQIDELQKRAEECGKLRARESAELEALKKRYVEEKCQWERTVRSVECELEDVSTRCATLCSELSTERDLVVSLRSEITTLEARLASGIEENEALYRRIKELEKPSIMTRDRARSVDSLSDLTNIDLDLDFTQIDKERIIDEYEDLRSRFEKAVSEIRAMKRELRESQAQSDILELSVVRARQEAKCKSEEAESNSRLMAARIQDLATKLSAAEKQIRSLKQKLSKAETKEKRRSLSLKGQESFTICKELEDKLSELENKVSALNSPTSRSSSLASTPEKTKDKKADKEAARLRRKSLDSVTSSESIKVLLRLNSLEAKVAKAQSSSPDSKHLELKLFNGECADIDGPPKTEMVSEVKKMENLLRAKLLVLAKKKESLIKAGQWNNEAKLNLLAEKLAYESVLIGRLHDAVIESKNLDLTDAERLITSLDCKLSGSKPNMETSLDYLVKSLAKHLTQQGVKRVSRKLKERKKQDPLVAEILSKKVDLDTKVNTYIEEVVDKLADVFAIETLAEDQGMEKSHDHIQAAWSLAQEAVNQELIQAEISQVLSQCSQTYQNYIESENQTRFAGLVKDRANLELWVSIADENLKTNMNSAIKKLQDEYQSRVEKLKSENSNPPKPSDQDEEKARELLNRFVDIVAHKSLMDARVSVLVNGEYSDMEQDASNYEENSLLSEIQFLYVKFCRELAQDSKDEERLTEVLEAIAHEVANLEGSHGASKTYDQVPTSPSDSWVEAICRKCEHLKDRIVALQQVAEENKTCKRCSILEQEIAKLETDHTVKLKELEAQKKEELEKLSLEFEGQKASLTQQYLLEERKLLERNKLLERRLDTLDSEYSQQMENLRATYNKTAGSPTGESEENLRNRYHTEIQHLRAVCEKGLVAMENAHRRRIAEIQEKHEQELEALKMEKEQALAEETHATLAALDAMRKAHEAEVQKEISKFKAEFLNKMQSSHDIDALHREHQAEMEEIKKEILSLSDKYSIKCVESASLEDKLRAANQQLAHAHQHILQLDARNKQLRAHLVAEASTDNVPRLLEHTHGVVPVRSHPIIGQASLQSVGCQTDTESSLSEVYVMEPPSLPRTEMRRSPESFSLCGMVSKRREMFERKFAPATCTRSSRATLN